MNATASAHSGNAANDESMRKPGRDIDLALARVRQLYCEDRPKEELLEALDSLIACARLHFEQETPLLKRPDHGQPDPHHQIHDNIIKYMELLRQYVDRFDQFGILPELHFIDYWLNTHDAAGILPVSPYGRRQRRLAPLDAGDAQQITITDSASR